MTQQIVLIGGTLTEGHITQVVSPGEDFQVYLSPGVTDVTGSIGLAEQVTPSAALSDFAMWQAGDPDPAQTYAGWSTAGLQSASTGYSRPWGIFYPPRDYHVSGGVRLWPRAAYMAVGFQFANVPASGQQNLTGVQAEVMPLSSADGLDDAPTPSPYQLPRTVTAIIKPNRLNYAPNPNFQISAAGWTTVGSATISATGLVTLHSPADSVYLNVPDLILGDQFTASLEAAFTAAGIQDVALVVGTQVGGIPGATGLDLAAGTYQPQLTFTAPASTVQLYVQPIYNSDVTFPLTVQLSETLIESGEIVGSYFDGSFGNPDYGWDGTPGLSRSYWYENWKPGQVVVNDIMTRQTPLSISAADPEYFSPPSQ